MLEKRESTSRSEQGIVTVRTTGQHDEAVCTFGRTGLDWKRGFGLTKD